VDWNKLAQDRDQWRVLFNTVMDIRAEELVTSQEELCFHGIDLQPKYH
jgi:hypothetical protein